MSTPLEPQKQARPEMTVAQAWSLFAPYRTASFETSYVMDRSCFDRIVATFARGKYRKRSRRRPVARRTV